MTQPPTQQIPGVYHRKIGDIAVTVISDGYLDGNLDVMRNVDLDKAHKILKDAFRPARRTSEAPRPGTPNNRTSASVATITLVASRLRQRS